MNNDSLKVVMVASEEELEKMVKEADQVLYDVENTGKGVYQFYIMH